MPATPLKYTATKSVGPATAPNVIIHGDNRKVLPALSSSYENRVKCIYIDPPYNNGEDYFHYNDSRSHKDWLAYMEETLTLLKGFLREDGSIWISIDDKEMHYLKVLADSIFGRENFVHTFIWQQRLTRENRNTFSNNHEYVLCFAANKEIFKNTRNLLPLSNSILDRYKNPDNDARGPWQSISANVQAGHAVPSQFYDLVSPAGRILSPPNGRCWVYTKEKMEREMASNNIYFGKNGMGVPRIKKFLNGSAKGVTPETLWLGEAVGTNELAKKHLLEIFPTRQLFETPKPESLIQHILNISTNPGDLVLDCFLGSGSTVTTAHKMERNYLGVELNKHAAELVSDRLRLVAQGEQGGISQDVNWQGGGEFAYFRWI